MLRLFSRLRLANVSADLISPVDCSRVRFARAPLSHAAMRCMIDRRRRGYDADRYRVRPVRMRRPVHALHAAHHLLGIFGSTSPRC